MNIYLERHFRDTHILENRILQMHMNILLQRFQGRLYRLMNCIFCIYNQLLLNILRVISQKYGHNL